MQKNIYIICNWCILIRRNIIVAKRRYHDEDRLRSGEYPGVSWFHGCPQKRKVSLTDVKTGGASPKI